MTELNPKVHERRGSARSPVFMLVQCKDGRGAMWAWDAGLGGLQCRSRVVRFPGTYLDVSFRLPGDAYRYHVGAQVTTLDRADDGSVSLGLRFCMVSPRLQMGLYRFLDRRRRLWSDEADAEPRDEIPHADPRDVIALPSVPPWPRPSERPFDGLLLHAFAALRDKETAHPDFDVRGPSADLLRLSHILGPTDDDGSGSRRA